MHKITQIKQKNSGILPTARTARTAARQLKEKTDMNYFTEHMKDLSDRSEKRGIYTFSPFLSLDEQSALHSMKKELCEFTLFGGTDGCERVCARFGSPKELGYEQPFPIACIGISPLSERFADELTHRDILGAVMSLGLERSQTGDIAVRGKHAYIFVNENKAEYICGELKKIKHTDVKCAVCEFDPSEPLCKTEEMTVIAASERADCIVGAVYNLSRSSVAELFAAKKVFINGSLASPSAHPQNGDIISVRGKGRFITRGETAKTKKNRTVLAIEKYI